MVKNYNNADLAENNVDSKYYLLYQLWKVLTAKKTLDTYQFRLMNTLSTLKELKKVIKQRLNRYHNSNHNIDDCKNETLEIIKDDLVLQEQYPVVRTRLISHLGEKTDTDAKQRVLLHQIDYALKIIEPHYFEKLVDSLKQSVDNREAFAILYKTNQVVSCCSSKGWSNNALYSVIGTLNGSKTDSLAWDKFKNKLCAVESEEYHILLPFKIRAINVPGQNKEAARERVLDEINRMGLQTIKVAEVLEQYSFLTDTDLEKNQIYLLATVSAHDVYSASHLAITKIANTWFTVYEIMDFFLSLLVDKSIQGINKCNYKKIVSFLIIFVISIFLLGLLGLWFYMAGEYFVAIFVWVLMVVFIIIAFKILHKIMKT